MDGLGNRLQGLKRKGDEMAYQNYIPDLGCKLAPSCLACPLPVCQYDESAVPPAHTQIRQERDRQMAMAVESGSTLEEVADQFGIVRATAYRAVRRFYIHNS